MNEYQKREKECNINIIDTIRTKFISILFRIRKRNSLSFRISNLISREFFLPKLQYFLSFKYI